MIVRVIERHAEDKMAAYLAATGEMIFDDLYLILETDVKYLDFKLDKTRVPSNKTTWRCQILPWTEEGDFHVIGSKPLIDNSDVTHHMIIFGCAGDGNVPHCVLRFFFSWFKISRTINFTSPIL